MRPVPTRKPCLGVLLCAVAGIELSEWLPCSLALGCLAACCFALASLLGRRAPPFWLFVFSIFLVRHELDWRRSPGRLPLDLLSQSVPVIDATGIVTSDPVSGAYAYHIPHYRFEMRVTQVACGGRTVETSFPAEVYWSGHPPDWGDEIAFTAAISPVAPPRNPGEYDLSANLARRGIFAQLSCDYPEDGEVLARGKGNPLFAWARNWRLFLQRRITAGIGDDQEIAGLVETITLGLKQETSITDRELFQRVGALHLFVVNGLHIALLALILGVLIKPWGIRRRAFAAVIIPMLFAYALVTGLNPGSLRAAIMAAVVFGASFVERRPFSYNTLAAAALVLLLCDTNELFLEGFQFSFGVVFAIMLLAERLQGLMLPLGVPDPFLPRRLWTRWQQGMDYCWRQVTGLAGVSVAASLGSFPFSAGYFHVVTPSGFLANLLLVPIAFCILAEAIFSLIASIAGPLALLFTNANWFLATAMLRVVHFFALLPGGYFFVPTSPIAPECRITVLDLSPGQAIVIQSRGAVWMVDCGSQSAYFHTVRPFLESRGVNRLDGLVLTHGAAASIGAAGEVMDDFAPREIIESSVRDRSTARRAVENSGHPITHVKSGDQWRLSAAATCSVLFPPAGFEAGAAADKSLVLRIDDGRNRVLLMSDSAFTGEHWLLEHSDAPRAAVVVLSGQSADLAGTEEFIEAVRPFAAVRGAPGYTAPGDDERQWASRLYRERVVPFLQSDAGAVTVDLGPAAVTVTGFMNGRRLIAGGQ